MLKKLSQIVITLVAALGLSVGLAGAAPNLTQPAECTGTYTRTVSLPQGAQFRGTTAGELVFAAGGNYVNTDGGADCVVLNGLGSIVFAGAGRDTVVSHGNGNIIFGEGADDSVYSYGRGDIIDGGTGTDTCVYNFVSSLANSCEQ